VLVPTILDSLEGHITVCLFLFDNYAHKEAGTHPHL
jgi:hypothetical protein